MLGARLVLGELIRRLDHRRRGGVARVVVDDVGPVRPESDRLLHDVEAAALVELQVDHHERLEPGAEPRTGAPHALRDGADLAVLTAQHRDDPVGFAQLVGAQHDRFITINRHGAILRCIRCHPREDGA